MADLRNIPAIRAEAEHQAEERQDALARRSYLCAWRDMPRSSRDIRIAAHLDLLCDLTRPASRDAVARLVAAKVGMFCHDTAPLFERHGADWKMTGTSGQSWWFATTEHSWLSVYGATGWTVIADLPPDFQEALRLIALHVLGAERVDAALVRS